MLGDVSQEVTLAKRKAWQEEQKLLKAWDEVFDERLHSSLNVVDFLKHPGEQTSHDQYEYRAAAVIALEVTAYRASERILAATQKVSLSSLLQATISLPWEFGDGAVTTVRRLTIEPAVSTTPVATPAGIESVE